MKDTETKERFIQLRAKGKSYASISRELRVSKGTLINWSKELGQQISNLEAIETEALMERHKVLQRHRIKSLSKALKKVEKELERRDLSSASDASLLKMQLALLDKLDNIYLTFERTKSYQEVQLDNMVGGVKERWEI